MAANAGTKIAALTAVIVTLLAVFAITATVLTVQGLLHNDSAPQPTTSAPPLLTTTQQKQLQQTVNAALVVQPNATWTVQRFQVGGEHPQHTRTGLAPGTSVETGAIIAVINERPIIALGGTIPMYRALSPGMKGDDVAQLQRELETLGYLIWDTPGTFGRSTAGAVFALYTDQSFTPVTVDGNPLTYKDVEQTGVPLGEIFFVPALPATASTNCGTVGIKVADDICTLISSEYTLTAEIPQTDAARVAPGQPLELTLNDGTTATGTLGQPETPTPTPANPTETPGTTPREPATAAGTAERTVRYAITLADNQPVTVRSRGTARIITARSAETAVVVEAVAINSEGNNTWIVLNDGNERAVTVGVCADGYCEISGDTITPGLSVRLPTPTAPAAPTTPAAQG